ncbi:alpha/beta fold hydrolase [Halobacillus sp. A5]|uniref:alpha/beta fold hydrolase n=1 Tax=Halobacillus sp. A5 TaxID=2880263 RepID=UPI0020A6A3A1|nr:alpha/beta hydrolase [Halobacillus sp. A5]MCP3027102.1 alpha/beta hydrolase [Halobacillus sp. A5]
MMILYNEAAGEGEPIVFLHSGLQTGNTDFVKQRETIKNLMKVITLDLRGHGKSLSNNLNNFFEDAADDLKETMEELEIEKFHLVGSSLGGLVGLIFAKKYPYFLISLTLSGITADRQDNWKELHGEDIRAQENLLHDTEIIKVLNQMHDSDWKQFIYKGRDEDWYPFEHTGDLEGIKAPILFMVGEGNKAEVESASKYQRLHDNVHVCVIPFASHLVHEQKPDVYTEVLMEFLNVIKEQ